MDVSGRRPTHQGASVGISEELRRQDGSEFWQVLYSEEGKEYVRDLLFNEYPFLSNSETYKHVVETLYNGTGRNTSREIRDKYPEHIVILRCQNSYRAYDESAEEFCSLWGLEAYKNAKDEVGVQIKDEDLSSFFLPYLKNKRINFAINGDKRLDVFTSTYKAPAKVGVASKDGKDPLKTDEELKIKPKTPGIKAEKKLQHKKTQAIPVVQKGMRVTLKENDGALFDVYLSDKEIAETFEVHLLGGVIEVAKKPITVVKGVHIITPNTQLSQSLFGQHVGEKIVCNGISYTIHAAWKDSSFLG